MCAKRGWNEKKESRRVDGNNTEARKGPLCEVIRKRGLMNKQLPLSYSRAVTHWQEEQHSRPPATPAQPLLTYPEKPRPHFNHQHSLLFLDQNVDSYHGLYPKHVSRHHPGPSIPILFIACQSCRRRPRRSVPTRLRRQRWGSPRHAPIQHPQVTI